MYQSAMASNIAQILSACIFFRCLGWGFAAGGGVSEVMEKRFSRRGDHLGCWIKLFHARTYGKSPCRDCRVLSTKL